MTHEARIAARKALNTPDALRVAAKAITADRDDPDWYDRVTAARRAVPAGYVDLIYAAMGTKSPVLCDAAALYLQLEALRLEDADMSAIASLVAAHWREVNPGPTDPPDFIRASGNTHCQTCGKPYYSHTLSRHIDYTGHHYLRHLCDGTLVKL